MKISKYISVFDEELMVYNALNNSLVKLSPNLIKIFQDRKIDDSIIGQYPNEIEELKKGLFLLDHDFDELQYIKFAHTFTKFQYSNLALTIAPTLNCNFNCYYCIQDVTVKKDDQYMTIETANDILTFIKNIHKKDNLNSLKITWYGGEPLLNFDVIKHLSKKIKDFTTNNNILYKASIITNGYLLSYDYAEFLSRHNVKIVQITLDGPQKIHDKRRRHKDNLGTYKVIIENIKNTANLFENIIIRFNIDKTNEIYLKDLIDEIRNEFHKFNNIVFYIFPVVSDTLDSCNFSKTLYSIEEFSKIKYKNKHLMPNILYPKLSYGSCGATRFNSFVISPNGNLHKCWNEITMENAAIGNLKKVSSNMSRFLKWINYDPTEIEKCKNCEILPICMGGTCPYRVLFSNKENSSMECNEYKYLLKEYILAWLENEKNKKKVAETY